MIKKPWGEVVREGSPHFPGGKMEIKATFRLVVEEWGGKGKVQM